MDMEMLQAMRELLDERLEAVMNERDKRLEAMMDERDERLKAMMDERVTQLEAKVDERVTQLEATMDAKFQPVLSRLDKLEDGQARMQNDLQSIKEDVGDVAWKVDVLYEWVDNVDLKVKKIDDRTK